MTALTISVLFVAICLCRGFTPTKGNLPFDVNVTKDGNYSLNVNGVTWLRSGPTFFNNNGHKYCSHEGSLKLLGSNVTEGEDTFGSWRSTAFTYRAGSLRAETSVKTYTGPSALPLAVFTQRYVNTAKQTQGKTKDDIISSFPSFWLPAAGSSPGLGYLSYGNDMAGWVSLSLGRFNAPQANFSTGIRGGPLVLFDKASNAMVISPYSKFMAASNRKFGDEHVSWGIMGLVDEVPTDYTVSFIVYFSKWGVNDAMRGWGKHLTTVYNKTDTSIRDSDLTLNYLGYWTDNGAYYYYNTELGKSYEDTIVDVVTSLKNQDIPIKYIQIDSWFYPKGHVHGTRTWVPERIVFPNGFSGLYARTGGLPIGCHNRYWDNDTTYASYNGGKYNFISDKTSGYAVPNDQQFWMDLFKAATEWGRFILYEQDWMDEETDKNMALLSDLDLGRTWLTQMGVAAARHHVTIQYCMAYSRHILQSLEVPYVTQARVSDDYQPGNSQWKIGITSMFTSAINLASSKDTFWTTAKQPGNPYSLYEKNPYVQTLMSVFSGGPVGSGDGIGYVNKSLIMKCCDSTGQILRPLRPLTIMDVSLKQAAFEGTNPNGRGEVLYATVSNVSLRLQATIVALSVVGKYSITPWDVDRDFPPVGDKTTNYIFNGEPDASGDYHPQLWDENSPLLINPSNCGDKLCVYHSVDVYGTNDYKRMGFLGELSKFSPRSPQRFTDVSFPEAGRVACSLKVNAGEVVDLTFMSVVHGHISVMTVPCDNSLGTEAKRYQAWADATGKSECRIEG